jgi:putative ABC transport system ATP-binding protein/macrolide transport system ATP-binding/permease protein/lipoprotein-releasing system ATP-binding protein
MTLAAQCVSKRYGGNGGHEAVRGVTLELRAGEFVSIVGRSGSGKSTLMAMLGALTAPNEGRVFINGTDIWAMPEPERATIRAHGIGFVFQFPSLLSNLTAVDNVALPAMLGRTMDAEQAYARAYHLLGRVGLAEHARAYPDTLAGGEQRRVALARALINSPPLILADEPTSDLDEDTEADVMELIGELQREQRFGLILVTHNIAIARRAQRSYEMRQGVLTTAALSDTTPEPQERPPRFAPIPAREPKKAVAALASGPITLGAELRRGLQTALIAGAAIFGAALLADFAVGKYQAMQLRERAARSAALQHLALNGLRGDVESVADLGDGRYQLITYLQNVGGGEPIYVMSPDMRAYVQVGTAWQEVPIKPLDGAPGVTKVAAKQNYRYVFDARVRDFAQLLPHYMHMRFSGAMLVSPRSKPEGDVFERKDNYYVYLKPFDVADETVLKRMRFSGRPPVWIPMPPH